MPPIRAAEVRYLKAVGLVSVFCVAMFFVRAFATGTTRFAFVPENLALAWLALAFAWFLVGQLKVRRWSSWQNVTLSVLWLLFLPNTWYVLTDFVHVVPGGDISQIYDIVMMSALVCAGFVLGFTSLFIVHKEFLKRWSQQKAGWAVAAILLLASFAIYLGRDLRWSSWDVITNPSGIILNVSDRVVDPFGHPRALNVTLLFFGLLSVLYLAIWQFLGPRHSSKR
jgi:uncharacterized membrane protein